MNDDVIMPGRAPLAEIDLGRLQRNGQAVTFEYVDQFGQPAEGFLMRVDAGYVAFENRCPHWAVPVVLDDDAPLEGGDLVCPMHGARFDPRTGACWEGPCLGDALERLDVTIEAGIATIRRRRLTLSVL